MKLRARHGGQAFGARGGQAAHGGQEFTLRLRALGEHPNGSGLTRTAARVTCAFSSQRQDWGESNRELNEESF
jgi:hypothetical protein